MEFEVKYNVIMMGEDGEYEELLSTIARVTYASKFVAATFYDPAEGGEVEFEFRLQDGSPDTFAEANCSDADRKKIEEYLMLGEYEQRRFRKINGWDY